MRENFGMSESPQKEAPPDEWYFNRKTGDHIRDPQRYRTEQIRQLVQKRLRKFADHFGDFSENVGDIKREKDPQDQSRYLN